MTYEEYRAQLDKALEEVDWMHPRDRNGPAYRVIARAAADRSLTTDEWESCTRSFTGGRRNEENEP